MKNIDGFCVTQICWGEAAEWAKVELIHSSLSVRTYGQPEAVLKFSKVTQTQYT